ncbi:unnamed protein product [Lepeophtheirus salmonis]|uniref:(salmon louse) hypothetical protein n=1 Tax=Lepeophtheirus salmonis TaxID=72036 RepID=A0A7R8D2E0_LEPSM|nr:unnamed protein product [Lepeophtheirus salmonis]CAF3004648.1 unnamed protein product [Lepeophtheirus salmonis]
MYVLLMLKMDHISLSYELTLRKRDGNGAIAPIGWNALLMEEMASPSLMERNHAVTLDPDSLKLRISLTSSQAPNYKHEQVVVVEEENNFTASSEEKREYQSPGMKTFQSKRRLHLPACLSVFLHREWISLHPEYKIKPRDLLDIYETRFEGGSKRRKPYVKKTKKVLTAAKEIKSVQWTPSTLMHLSLIGQKVDELLVENPHLDYTSKLREEWLQYYPDSTLTGRNLKARLFLYNKTRPDNASHSKRNDMWNKQAIDLLVNIYKQLSLDEKCSSKLGDSLSHHWRKEYKGLLGVTSQSLMTKIEELLEKEPNLFLDTCPQNGELIITEAPSASNSIEESFRPSSTSPSLDNRIPLPPKNSYELDCCLTEDLLNIRNNLKDFYPNCDIFEKPYLKQPRKAGLVGAILNEWNKIHPRNSDSVRSLVSRLYKYDRIPEMNDMSSLENRSKYKSYQNGECKSQEFTESKDYEDLDWTDEMLCHLKETREYAEMKAEENVNRTPSLQAVTKIWKNRWKSIYPDLNFDWKDVVEKYNSQFCYSSSISTDEMSNVLKISRLKCETSVLPVGESGDSEVKGFRQWNATMKQGLINTKEKIMRALYPKTIDLQSKQFATLLFNEFRKSFPKCMESTRSLLSKLQSIEKEGFVPLIKEDRPLTNNSEENEENLMISPGFEGETPASSMNEVMPQVVGFPNWSLAMIRDFIACMDVARRKYASLKDESISTKQNQPRLIPLLINEWKEIYPESSETDKTFLEKIKHLKVQKETIKKYLSQSGLLPRRETPNEEVKIEPQENNEEKFYWNKSMIEDVIKTRDSALKRLGENNLPPKKAYTNWTKEDKEQLLDLAFKLQNNTDQEDLKTKGFGAVLRDEWKLLRPDRGDHPSTLNLLYAKYLKEVKVDTDKIEANNSKERNVEERMFDLRENVVVNTSWNFTPEARKNLNAIFTRKKLELASNLHKAFIKKFQDCPLIPSALLNEVDMFRSKVSANVLENNESYKIWTPLMINNMIETSKKIALQMKKASPNPEFFNFSQVWHQEFVKLHPECPSTKRNLVRKYKWYKSETEQSMPIKKDNCLNTFRDSYISDQVSIPSKYIRKDFLLHIKSLLQESQTSLPPLLPPRNQLFNSENDSSSELEKQENQDSNSEDTKTQECFRFPGGAKLIPIHKKSVDIVDSCHKSNADSNYAVLSVLKIPSRVENRLQELDLSAKDFHDLLSCYTIAREEYINYLNRGYLAFFFPFALQVIWFRQKKDSASNYPKVNGRNLTGLIEMFLEEFYSCRSENFPPLEFITTVPCKFNVTELTLKQVISCFAEAISNSKLEYSKDVNAYESWKNLHPKINFSFKELVSLHRMLIFESNQDIDLLENLTLDCAISEIWFQFAKPEDIQEWNLDVHNFIRSENKTIIESTSESEYHLPGNPIPDFDNNYKDDMEESSKVTIEEVLRRIDEKGKRSVVWTSDVMRDLLKAREESRRKKKDIDKDVRLQKVDNLFLEEWKKVRPKLSHLSIWTLNAYTENSGIKSNTALVKYFPNTCIPVYDIALVRSLSEVSKEVKDLIFTRQRAMEVKVIDKSNYTLDYLWPIEWKKIYGVDVPANHLKNKLWSVERFPANMERLQVALYRGNLTYETIHHPCVQNDSYMPILPRRYIFPEEQIIRTPFRFSHKLSFHDSSFGANGIRHVSRKRNIQNVVSLCSELSNHKEMSLEIPKVYIPNGGCELYSVKLQPKRTKMNVPAASGFCSLSYDNSGAFFCNECGKKFRNINNYKYHVYMH